MRIGFLFLLLSVTAAQAQVTHYQLKLTPDLDHHLLRGEETIFYCEAWMVCDNTPAERATLTMEIVLPAASGLKAVGPGQLQKLWRDPEGEHFNFEQDEPVQTYLFSLGVARLNRSVHVTKC